MVKIARKIKKKKGSHLSTGLKAAIGVLGGVAAASGIINKAPAGIVRVIEQEKNDANAGSGGDKTIAESAREALGVPEASAAYDRLQLYQTILPSGTIKLDDSVTELAKLKSDPTYGGGNTFARTPNGIVNLLNGQIVVPAADLHYDNVLPSDQTNITSALASVGAPAAHQVGPAAEQSAAPTGSVLAVKADKAAPAKKTAATGQIARSTQSTHNEAIHIVQKGDSLWKIAQQHYGSGAKWRQIYNANRDKIQDPKLIFPGQELNIPPAA